MQIEDEIINQIQSILNSIDLIESPENKRNLVSWIANVWTHSIRTLAGYTNVTGDMRPKVRQNISDQLAALKLSLEKKS